MPEGLVQISGGESVSDLMGWKMKHKLRKLLFGVMLPVVASLHAHSQDVTFVPEVDANFELTSTYRVYVEAKNERDGGDPNQLGIGPSFQMYLKPIVKLKAINSFDLDDSKSRAFVLESGYRSIVAPDAPYESRVETIATLHFPLKKGFLLSDRNRADLDWKSGSFSWRYHNKLTLERTLAASKYHFIPYVAAEPYYESQYAKWSTTALYAGCLVPVGRRVEFNTYYEHENNTGKSPNQQVNAIGLAVYLYFRHEKK
jgi:hypothetical protein